MGLNKCKMCSSTFFCTNIIQQMNNVSGGFRTYFWVTSKKEVGLNSSDLNANYNVPKLSVARKIQLVAA